MKTLRYIAQDWELQLVSEPAARRASCRAGCQEEDSAICSCNCKYLIIVWMFSFRVPKIFFSGAPWKVKIEEKVAPRCVEVSVTEVIEELHHRPTIKHSGTVSDAGTIRVRTTTVYPVLRLAASQIFVSSYPKPGLKACLVLAPNSMGQITPGFWIKR